MTKRFRNLFFHIVIFTALTLLIAVLFLYRKTETSYTVETSCEVSLDENVLYLYGYLPMKEDKADAVAWWRSDVDGFYYFFLPKEAKGVDVRVAFHFPDVETLTWGASVYHSGDVVAELCEGAIAIVIGETTYPVKVMYGDDIPTVMIQTDSHSMDMVDSTLGFEEKGNIWVSDSSSSYFYDGPLSYIRGRGNSSFGYDKKSYQIHFPDKTGLCGMDKAKNWVLLPQFFDHTGLRNGLTFELARELQLSFTPDYRYINLYLNGNYHGFYLVTDKVEVSQARINIRDLDEFYHSSERETDTELPTFGEKEYVKNTCKGYVLDCTPDDISGGYLLELELPERYAYAGNCGFVTSRGQAVIIKSPSYATETEVNYIRNWYQEFEDAAYSPDGYHPVNGKHYTDYLDLTTAAAKYLLEEWIKNPDAGKTSQFFYKPASSVSDRMYAGPVWDYDIAYGNLAGFSHPEGLWASYLDQECNLYTALCSHEDFLKEVKHQYTDIVLPFFKEQIPNYIHSNASITQTSVYMSSIRWNAYHTTDYTEFEGSYKSDLDYITTYLEQRSSYLNAIWLENKISHDVYVDIRECDSFYLQTDNHVSVLDGECTYFLYPPVKTGYVFDHWHNKKTGEEFDLSTPITEDNLILQPVFVAE